MGVTGMDDLVTWLRAQLDRQEAALIAYRDHDAGLTPCINYEGQDPADYDEYDTCSRHLQTSAATEYSNVEFGLAEVGAKRRILELHAENVHHECELCGEREGGDWPCSTVRLLGLPLADRPGHRDEWRP